MKEKTAELQVRCTPKFKATIKAIVEKEETEISELTRRSLREHQDNTTGVKRVLGMLELTGDATIVCRMPNERVRKIARLKGWETKTDNQDNVVVTSLGYKCKKFLRGS